MKAKRATVDGYEPFYGSDNEEEEKKTKEGKTPTPDEVEKPSDTEIDAMEAYER
jgi:hypothetical protein